MGITFYSVETVNIWRGVAEADIKLARLNKMISILKVVDICFIRHDKKSDIRQMPDIKSDIRQMLDIESDIWPVCTE